MNFETPKVTEEVSFRDFAVEALAQKVASIPVWYDYEYKEQFDLIMNFLDSKINPEFGDLNLSDVDRKAIAEEFLKSNMGFGPLDRLIAEENTVSVFTDSNGSVFAELESGIVKTDLVLTKNQFASVERRFKSNSPVVKAALNDLTVTILKPPVADNVLIIKKCRKISETLNTITASGKIPENLKIFLQYILDSRKNIVVAADRFSEAAGFARVCINSINQDKRVAYIDEYPAGGFEHENVTEFSTASIDDFDYEYLLSAIEGLNFDYKISELSNFNKFAAYYQKCELSDNGRISIVRASGPNDAAAKFIQAAAAEMKITEKQAKQKFSSTFDYLIQIGKDSNGFYRVESVYEIGSTKTSALVMHEIVKFVGDDYVLDLPEIPEISELEDVRSLRSFRERLK